ncbi:g283 [Coccomyxa elongata]
MLRLDVVYPKNGKTQGMLPPYPLVIISSGFLTAASSYFSYARRLATWGYTVVMYDKVESATEPLDDRLCVELIREIIDWAKLDPVLSQLADTDTTYLCGHSRGGKVSALAAAVDPRVKAVCLLDPVDVTVYTPQGPDFPSAVAAIRHMSRGVPLAIVGSGRAGDCVPKDSNYKRYYNACQAPAWEVVLGSAGHFQFLDEQSMLQRAVCAVGPVEDSSVREIAQTVMVAWGEIMLKGRSLRPELVTPDLTDGDLVAALPSGSEATRQALLAAQRLIERGTNKIALTVRLKNI